MHLFRSIVHLVFFIFDFRSTIYNDAVSLLVNLKRYRSQEYAMSNSGWILLDAAEQIFKIVRERVYNSKDGKSLLIHFKTVVHRTDEIFSSKILQNLSQKIVQNGILYRKYSVLKYQIVQKMQLKRVIEQLTNRLSF